MLPTIVARAIFVASCLSASVLGAPGKPQGMPIGAIGWTQKTASSKVFDVETKDYTSTIEKEVEKALAIPSTSDRQSHFRSRFDPLVVYEDPKAGFLSVDNRRLAIYRMSLPSDAKMPVKLVTKEEAGKEIADRLNPERVEAGLRQLTPLQAIAKRYQSKDGGYSINIKCPDTGCKTVSQGITYVQSPYMTMDAPSSHGGLW